MNFEGVYSNARLRVGVVGEVRNEHLPLHSCTVSVSRALLDRDGNLSPAVAGSFNSLLICYRPKWS